MKYDGESSHSKKLSLIQGPLLSMELESEMLILSKRSH